MANNVKRKKNTRFPGRRTAGHGSTKKTRGKGSRGGKGMAGTGKKAGQKKTLVLKLYGKYLGKKGFVRHGASKKELKVINLEDLNKKLSIFEKKGVAKKTSEGIEFNLSEYKVLGKGEVTEKLIINAGSFSESAKEKITAKGGKALQK